MAKLPDIPYSAGVPRAQPEDINAPARVAAGRTAIATAISGAARDISVGVQNFKKAQEATAIAEARQKLLERERAFELDLTENPLNEDGTPRVFDTNIALQDFRLKAHADITDTIKNPRVRQVVEDNLNTQIDTFEQKHLVSRGKAINEYHLNRGRQGVKDSLEMGDFDSARMWITTLRDTGSITGEEQRQQLREVREAERLQKVVSSVKTAATEKDIWAVDVAGFDPKTQGKIRAAQVERVSQVIQNDLGEKLRVEAQVSVNRAVSRFEKEFADVLARKSSTFNGGEEEKQSILKAMSNVGAEYKARLKELDSRQKKLEAGQSVDNLLQFQTMNPNKKQRKSMDADIEEHWNELLEESDGSQYFVENQPTMLGLVEFQARSMNHIAPQTLAVMNNFDAKDPQSVAAAQRFYAVIPENTRVKFASKLKKINEYNAHLAAAGGDQARAGETYNIVNSPDPVKLEQQKAVSKSTMSIIDDEKLFKSILGDIGVEEEALAPDIMAQIRQAVTASAHPGLSPEVNARTIASRILNDSGLGEPLDIKNNMQQGQAVRNPVGRTVPDEWKKDVAKQIDAAVKATEKRNGEKYDNVLTVNRGVYTDRDGNVHESVDIYGFTKEGTIATIASEIPISPQITPRWQKEEAERQKQEKLLEAKNAAQLEAQRTGKPVSVPHPDFPKQLQKAMVFYPKTEQDIIEQENRERRKRRLGQIGTAPAVLGRATLQAIGGIFE